MKKNNGQEGSQGNAVKKSDASIVTAASAIKTIIEDPLLSILEENSNKT